MKEHGKTLSAPAGDAVKASAFVALAACLGAMYWLWPRLSAPQRWTAYPVIVLIMGLVALQAAQPRPPLKTVRLLRGRMRVSDGERRIEVDLSDVESVTEHLRYDIRVVEVKLRRETEFGRSFCFKPRAAHTAGGVVPHPVVTELRREAGL